MVSDSVEPFVTWHSSWYVYLVSFLINLFFNHILIVISQCKNWKGVVKCLLFCFKVFGDHEVK